MKKRIFLFSLIVFLALANSVFAQNFTTAKQVGSIWEDTTEFGWTQKPWLHFEVPSWDNDFTGDLILSFWNYPTPPSSNFLSNLFTDYDHVRVDSSDIYLSFKDDATWNSIKKAGDWQVNSAVILFKPAGVGDLLPWGNITAYSGTTNFKVVPEPISAGLFLLGGGALVLVKRSRRKA